MLRLMGRPHGVRRARSKWNWQLIAVKEPGVAAWRLAGCQGWNPQLVGAGPTGPRKGMKILEIGQNGGVGSGEIEISHGGIEAEQLFDPERA